MSTLAVLLRGINVGKAKQVGMADLRDALEQAGYGRPRTLLRSGNVVVDSDQSPAKAAAAIEALLLERFGFAVAVVVRTGEELAAIVDADPLGDVADNPSRKLVAFLSAEPDAERLAPLVERDFDPELLVAAGRELYLWCPNGQADGVLPAQLAKAKLGVTVTVRNWSTVEKLLALARAD
jgi:uncharacterized protein (DUF1697 family)